MKLGVLPCTHLWTLKLFLCFHLCIFLRGLLWQSEQHLLRQGKDTPAFRLLGTAAGRAAGPAHWSASEQIRGPSSRGKLFKRQGDLTQMLKINPWLIFRVCCGSKQTGRWAVLAAGVFSLLTRVPCHHFRLLPQFFEVNEPVSRTKFRAETESRGTHQETLLTSLPLPLAWQESDEKQGHCVESSTVPFAVRVTLRSSPSP